MAAKRETITEEENLREIIGQPMDLAVKKAIDHLDKHCQAYIERSPFVCVGTSSPDGACDVSPRGDAPGFVQIIDEKTLFLPDRPGNNRVDTMGNIVENGHTGLLFLIPGFQETLRVNGTAEIIQDEELLTNATVKNKTPKVGILVHVEEAYLHCAKAIKRSKLWDPESIQDRTEMPSLGKIILEQTAPPEEPPTEDVVTHVDEVIEDNYKNELY
ncbi:MAG: pyridoxamine 5'-phosphate oxidase family protein [Pseudomonadota bacterium]